MEMGFVCCSYGQQLVIAATGSEADHNADQMKTINMSKRHKKDTLFDRLRAKWGTGIGKFLELSASQTSSRPS
jgi:hypothetical protein